MAKKSVKKNTKKTAKKSSLVLINLKVSREEKKTLIARANKYETGNLSAWIRRAGTNYVPKTSKGPVAKPVADQLKKSA